MKKLPDYTVESIGGIRRWPDPTLDSRGGMRSGLK